MLNYICSQGNQMIAWCLVFRLRRQAFLLSLIFNSWGENCFAFHPSVRLNYILRRQIFALLNAERLHGRVCQIIVHWSSELQEQQICPPGVVKYSCHTWCNVASLMQRDGRWHLAGLCGSTTEGPVIFNTRQSLWQFTLAATDAESFIRFIFP